MSADLRAAAQQALEALRELLPDERDPNCGGYDARDVRQWRATATALRAALAQQAEPVQEPAYKVKVAGRWHDTEPLVPAFSLPDGEHLLYTAPPQRPAKPVE